MRTFGRHVLTERPLPAHLAEGVTDPTWGLVLFPNGLGASIIRHLYSYGGTSGRWELAVVTHVGDDWQLYSGEDTIGWLTATEVAAILDLISDGVVTIERRKSQWEDQ